MSGVRDFSTAYPDILLLVVNRSDGVERVVDSVSDILKGCGFRIHVQSVDEKTSIRLLDYYQLILCGDASGGSAFDRLVQSLQEEGPDLSHLAFGVLDAGGGQERRRWGPVVDALEALGAVEVVELHRNKSKRGHDGLSASQYWALDCVAAFSEAFAPVDSDTFE